MPRHAALAILSRWDPRRNHLEDLLPGPLGKLDARDAALARHLTEETVRHVRLLDHWIDQLARPIGKNGRPSPPRTLDPDTRDLLRLGLVQLRFTRIPAHAALDTTTGMAPQRSRGFVNALLRRATREPDSLDRWAAESPPAVRHGLSDELWNHWCRRHGAAGAEKLASTLEIPAPVSFRINTFHPGHPAVAADPRLLPVPGHPGFFRIDGPIPGPWLADGLLAVQDPGAALATDLLNPQPGESVLDACASPGGKSRRLAEMAGENGRVLAVDLIGRLTRLQENLRRWQVPGVDCQPVDWLYNPPFEPSTFDAILVDAPCTNTGVLRRRPEARLRFSPETLGHALDLQKRILDAVAPLVRPGGRLVYSTCSLENEENEDQAAAFLTRHPGWSMGEIRRSNFPDGEADGHFAVALTRH